MSTRILGATAVLAVLLVPMTALAETQVVDGHLQLVDSAHKRPSRGQTMGQVEAAFGAPQTRHEAVGKPPITRWDYPSFSVFFEGDRVVHAVAVDGEAPPAAPTAAAPAAAPAATAP